MTRVLHLIPSFLPGGAERQLAYLSAGLRGLGHPVHVGALTDGPMRERCEAAGVEIHMLRARSNYDPLLVLRIARLIRRIRPALVQTWIPLMDVMGGAAARLAGVPWVLSERASPFEMTLTRKDRLRAWLARGAAGVVSNSQGGEAYWRAILGERVPRTVIHNALPLEDLVSAEPPSLEEFGIPEDRPLVLYLGRITEGKCVDVLVRALARVCRETESVGVLCGFGSLEAAARGWIARAGLSGRVAVTGFVPRGYALLKRASVFVSLSEFEGMPNAVMEAMALGCPAVVSDIPAHRELLDASSAVFVPIEADAAADALLGVLRDPAAAARRAARARARTAQWSIGTVASAYAAFYEAVLSGRAGRS